MAKVAEQLERYKQLLKGAAKLEKIAHPDAAAGPSFWEGMRKATAAAIEGDVSKAVDSNWSLSADEMRAVGKVVGEFLSPIWSAAAADLRAQAASMLRELESERAELDKVIGELAGGDGT